MLTRLTGSGKWKAPTMVWISAAPSPISTTSASSSLPSSGPFGAGYWYGVWMPYWRRHLPTKQNPPRGDSPPYLPDGPGAARPNGFLLGSFFLGSFFGAGAPPAIAPRLGCPEVDLHTSKIPLSSKTHFTLSGHDVLFRENGILRFGILKAHLQSARPLAGARSKHRSSVTIGQLPNACIVIVSYALW